MKTEHLREFVVFSQHLNFSTAAKELYLAQSTLSMHMAQLEDDLEMRLINRKAGNQLTEQGVVFLEGAQAALAAIDGSLERCKYLREAERSVKVAITLPSADFVKNLRRKSPSPLSFVDPDFRDPFFSLLANGKADVLVTYDFSMSALLMREAEASELVIVKGPKSPSSISMMKTNPLANRIPLKRSDLKGAHITVNSAPDYERHKTVCNSMFGEGLGLTYSLVPVGSLSDLKLLDYGDSLHVCAAMVNDHYFADRDDTVIVDELDGKPFGYPSAIVYRADASEEVLRCAEAIAECLNEQSEEAGLNS